MGSVYLALIAMIWWSCGWECIWVGLVHDNCGNLVLWFGDEAQPLEIFVLGGS
jgi:hypothetical protein